MALLFQHLQAASTVPYKQSTSGATETFEFSWTIENISRFSDDFMNSPMLYSPTFIAPPDKVTNEDKKPVEFELRFEPGGFSTKFFAIIYLQVRNRPSSSLEILFTHSVVKVNGEKHVLASKWKVCTLNMAQMRHTELYNPANGFLSNDSLTFHCEVSIRMDKLEMGDQLQQLQLLAKSYGDLLESGTHSDVTFVLDDGQELRAHKIILAARSQMFADMCQFSQADSSNDRVKIVETRVEVFKQMLNFIYTGQVGASLNGIAQDLLICADKYQLDSLKSICEDCLVTSLTGKSDLIELHELAKRINAPKLQAKVVDLLRNDVDGLITKVFQLKRQLSTMEAANSNTNKKSKKSY